MAEFKVKAWMEAKGEYVLGRGTARLLRLVAEEGSISGAARRMAMSYRHAWGLIRDLETAFGRKVVATRRGGRAGGGTRLTRAGSRLLKDFERKELALFTYVDGGMRVPFLAVDGIITMDGELVLIRRKWPPFEGTYALPGGMVEYGEPVEDAVKREMREETGLRTEPVRLVGVYSDPDRDPRGHTISVVFELKVVGGRLRAGDDAKEAARFPFSSLPKLAFDHDRIIEDYLESQ